MAALAQGQFQQATNGSSVLFIESVDGSDFKDVFLAQIRPKGNARPSVVVADSGHLTQLRDGSQGRHSQPGERASKALHCYAISALRTSEDYQAIIGHQCGGARPERYRPDGHAHIVEH